MRPQGCSNLMTVNYLDAIVERQVEEARAQGFFDNLALKGRPIPDLERRREEGWWANMAVARARAEVEAEAERAALEHQGSVRPRSTPVEP